MDENINKHLHDILDAIDEIESFFGDKPKYFNEFCNDLCLRRAVERMQGTISSMVMTVFQPTYSGV